MYERFWNTAGLTLRASRILPSAAIVFGPLLAAVVLRAPAFNNLAYRDPWFYSGYGWALAHHIEIFGWFYYAARFPVTLLIGWSTALFGPIAGYLTLRYVLLVLTGGAVYACIRRFASVGVATAGVMALLLNPFFLRSILWDYTSFVALPCGIIGVALWFRSSTTTRVLGPFILSGAALGTAVFANAFSASFILPLVLVESGAAIRSGWGELARFAQRCGAALLGGVLVFLAGYIGYRAYLGSFSPRDLIEPSLDFVRSNRDVAGSFERPAREFLTGEPRIYAPLFPCLALLVLGRGLIGRDLPARLAQYAVMYVGLLWLSRALHKSAAIETWWAYNSTAIATCFAVPVVLDHLVRVKAADERLLLAAVLGTTAITTYAVRQDNAAAVDVYDAIRSHVELLAIILAVGIAVVAVLAVSRVASIRVVMSTALFGLTAFLALTPAGYLGIRATGEFTTRSSEERLAYAAAYKATQILEQWDKPDSRTLFWTTLAGPAMIAWLDLPNQAGGIVNAESPPSNLGHLTRQELDLVRYPTTGELLLLSDHAADMRHGVAELRRRQARPTVLRAGTWAGGQLAYALVEVYTPPP